MTKIARRYKIMINKLKHRVSFKWIIKYDINKIKVLNKMKRRLKLNSATYKSYIEKFYNDPEFNRIYNLWEKNNNNTFYKPSIDHIIPGTNDSLDNLQVLTWFENRCKSNIPIDEFKSLKSDIKNLFS